MSRMVLIADDVPPMREICARIVAKCGYNVIEAEDGLQAVEMYRKGYPDAVILDVSMPKLDGLKALAQIREIDTEARVVILTAEGHPSMVSEAIRLGAKDFVVKPFTPDRIALALKRLLA